MTTHLLSLCSTSLRNVNCRDKSPLWLAAVFLLQANAQVGLGKLSEDNEAIMPLLEFGLLQPTHSPTLPGQYRFDDRLLAWMIGACQR